MIPAKTIFTFGYTTTLLTAILFISFSTASAAGLTLLGDSDSALHFYKACSEYNLLIYLISFSCTFLVCSFYVMDYLSNPKRKPLRFNL